MSAEHAPELESPARREYALRDVRAGEEDRKTESRVFCLPKIRLAFFPRRLRTKCLRGGPEARAFDHAGQFTRRYPILTTTRPRTPPSTMRRPASMTPDRSISLVIAASLLASMSDANRFQASRRRSSGHITESTPTSDTPRRMNGATVAGRSIPPASPQAATAPP